MQCVFYSEESGEVTCDDSSTMCHVTTVMACNACCFNGGRLKFC